MPAGEADQVLSVVVPAHDEATVIGECLRALSTGARAGELEIVVVCNGCSDDTAALCRAWGGPVRVLETPVASKALALRLGDAEARFFPRFYVDADVVLPLTDLRAVAEVLRRGPWLAAAPTLDVDLRGCSWAVRSYYRIWTRLPYHDASMIGSGVYALSEAGRRRFAEIPDLIADDEFVRRHFKPAERKRVEGAHFRIRAPRTLRGVIAVKTRSQKGGLQLDDALPALRRNARKRYGRALRAIASDWRCWLPSLVYVYVVAVTKGRAHWMRARGSYGGWERDDSSRAPTRARTGPRDGSS